LRKKDSGIALIFLLSASAANARGILSAMLDGGGSKESQLNIRSGDGNRFTSVALDRKPIDYHSSTHSNPELGTLD
jgi:hypothetical protein